MYLFPDGEKIMVASIREAMRKAGETGIRVATRKATPQEENNANYTSQITVRSDGGLIFERVGKDEDFGINIFVKNSNRNAAYAEANRLASILEAVIPFTPGIVSHQLKHVEILGVTPIETDAEEQQRYMRITATLQASSLFI